MERCCFCDGKLDEMNGIWYCQHCQKIMFMHRKSNEGIRTAVLEHIEKNREILIRNQMALHNLLQRKLDGEHLSKEDLNTLAFCELFHSVANELEFLFSKGVIPSHARIRELLYQLLLLENP